MAVVPIRKPTEGAPGKMVEANQKAVDALPFNSGMWRVEGVPGLYVLSGPNEDLSTGAPG